MSRSAGAGALGQTTNSRGSETKGDWRMVRVADANVRNEGRVSTPTSAAWVAG